MSKEEKYYVYEKENGFPAVSMKKQNLTLIAETKNVEDAEAAIKKYLDKTVIEHNTDVINKSFDALKKSENCDRKINDKIRYMVGLSFSDRMYDDRDIAFDIVMPIQFKSKKQAVDNQGLFFARMEYSDKEKEVVINIYSYGTGLKSRQSEIIKTIKWCDFYSYKCSTTREKSIGKIIIDPAIDEEPCAEKFEVILKKLTKKDSFSLQSLAYWVEPAFQNLDIRQW